jgi:hypothetical protein
MGNSEEISHDRTGTYAHGYTDPHGTGFDRHTDDLGQNTGRTAKDVDDPARSHEPPAGANPANSQQFASLDTAIARFKQCVQELGTLVAALEQFIKRQEPYGVKRIKRGKAICLRVCVYKIQ